MHLDYSRYSAFWTNPERFRLCYLQNLHPKTMPYGLARGAAFHLIAESMAKNETKEQISEHWGDTEGMTEEAIANAWRMYEAYRGYVNNPHPPKVLEMEREWQLPLTTHHSLCGRVDQIIESDAGIFVLDTKTAHAKTQLARTKKDWLTNKQADFLLIGAAALGYTPKCLMIHVILETTPPRVWEIPVTRTATQLAQLKHNALLTCEIIQMLTHRYGIDQPWPHLDSQWPCSTLDRCDYRTICGRPWTLGHVPVGFKPRKEHLALLTPKHPPQGDGNDAS